MEAKIRLPAALRSFYGDYTNDIVIGMDLDMTADGFVLMGQPQNKPPIQHVYWNYGVALKDEYERAEKKRILRDLRSYHNPRFAAEIEPSLPIGIQGLAIGFNPVLGD
jgi:hypothetical protein